MNHTVYNLSNVFTLDFKGNALIATYDDGKTLSIPIEPLALVELGNSHLVLASKQEEKLTSERDSAVMDFDLVDEIFALRGKPQTEAFRAIHDKLHALSKIEPFDNAAGGFAVALLNVLQIGIANLPKVGAEE